VSRLLSSGASKSYPELFSELAMVKEEWKIHTLLFVCLFVFVGLGFELRVSHSQSRHSAT
jgi:hypothetical protein